MTDLEEGLVAIEKSKEIASGIRIANPDKVPCDDTKLLEHAKERQLHNNCAINLK